MKLTTSSLLAVFLVALAPSIAGANVIWDWSFDDSAGQFTTDGSDPSVAGVFTMIDFSVTSTGTSAALGSISGGQYSAGGFMTDDPYTMDWNGNSVTSWGHHGGNSFDWWAFDDLESVGHFFFGWETNNINTVDQAVYFLGNIAAPSFTLSVAPIPEPSTALLMGLGLAVLGARRRKALRH
jgi:hypothetical protein